MIFQRDELAVRYLEKMLNDAGAKKSDGVVIRECTPLDAAGGEYKFKLFRGYCIAMLDVVIPSVYVSYLSQATFLINSRSTSYEEAVAVISVWLHRE